MKNKSILFGLLATTALMLGACNGDQPASSEPQPSSEPSSEVTSSEPESSEPEVVDYGTLEAPISVEAANKIIDKELAIGEKTAQPLVVKGIMRLGGKEGYSQSYKNYTFYLHDEAKDAQKLYVFRAGVKEGLEEIAYENDTVIVSGYVVDYQGTYEMANSGDDKALLNSIVARGTSSITVNCGENGSVSEIASSALNGTEISFTATPATGYKVGSVKVNGALIEAEEGAYKFVVKGNMTVAVEFVEEGAAVTNYGTQEAPLSITEALALAAEECKENGNFTAKPVVAKGLVKATKSLGTYTSFRLDLLDVANAEVSILVYTLEPGEYKDLYAGDELIISGYIKNYTKSGSDPVLEFDVNGSAGVTPSILSLVRGKATVTLGAHEHATVTGLPEEAVDNGTEVSFTVAADEGYKVDAVKVNGKVLEAVEGVYKFVAAGAMEITVEASEEGAVVANTVTLDATELLAHGMTSEAGEQTYEYHGLKVVVENGLVNGHLRVYKGKNITFTAAKITSIVFTCMANGTTKYGPGCFGAIEGYTFEAEGNKGTWEGEAASVILNATGDQVRATSIVVTYFAA